MIFKTTELAGVHIIEIQKMEDERGFFARSFCQNEFREHGLDPNIAQCDISFNKTRGTLRGMHYQIPPFAETKLVRCTRGRIYDVAIDLRPDSPTYLHWASFELSADNYLMLYIPKGFAHGFLTLTDDVEIAYQMSESYAPGAAYGIRWNDPQFKIVWPEPVQCISVKDQGLPDCCREDFAIFAGAL